MARKIPKWYSDDKALLERYDRAVLAVRRKLGSYDTIAHMLYAHTGQSCAGVSIRRWFNTRTLPITWAVSMCEVMDGDLSIYEFFPFLENVTVGEYLS